MNTKTSPLMLPHRLRWNELRTVRYPLMGYPVPFGIKMLCTSDRGPVTRKGLTLRNETLQLDLMSPFMHNVEIVLSAGNPIDYATTNKTKSLVINRSGYGLRDGVRVLATDFVAEPHLPWVERQKQLRKWFQELPDDLKRIITPVAATKIYSQLDLLNHETNCQKIGYSAVCLFSSDGEYQPGRPAKSTQLALRLNTFVYDAAEVLSVAPNTGLTDLYTVFCEKFEFPFTVEVFKSYGAGEHLTFKHRPSDQVTSGKRPKHPTFVKFDM